MMSGDTKEQIEFILDALKKVMKENGVGLATDADGHIYFLDINSFADEGKMSGIKIHIDDLVD